MAHIKIALVAVALLVLFLYGVGAQDDLNGFTCADSDGINYYNKGSVTYTDYVEDIGDVKLPDGTYMDTVDDVCLILGEYPHEQYDENYSGTHINEYYCNDTRLGADTYLCSSGCIDGACLKEQKASIGITSKPSGAQVYVVDSSKGITVFYGKTPISFGMTLAEKTTFLFMFTKKGYEDNSLLVDIVPDSTINIVHAELKKASYGKIKVTSNPSRADVYIDERYAGITPITLEGISAGTHAVTVKLAGYKDYSKEVEVNANETTSLKARLTKIKSTSGNIKVTSSPSKADVYLAGQNVGKTPITIKSVAVGEYTLEVKLKGYNSYKTTVKVSAGRTTPVRAKLTKSTAKTTGAATASISRVKCSAKSIIGDADGSKSITPGDSLLISNIVLGIEVKPSNICCVDVDNDKDIDNNDALQVFNYYTGSQTSGNVGKKCSEITSKTGKLKVTSSPSKADAYIRKSGVDEWEGIGKTPVTIKSLATGSYEVSLKKKGYLEARQTVSVSANRTTPLRIKLLKETKAVCTDSDGGKDYYVKGYATTGGNIKTEDICSWEKNAEENVLTETYTLYEAYCDSKSRIRTDTYKCPQGCENGACIKEVETKCEDSDGGKDYYVKGIADARVNGLGDFGEDRCSSYEGGKGGLESIVESCSGSDCYLTEGYCEGSEPMYESWVSCTNGCSNGACVK